MRRDDFVDYFAVPDHQLQVHARLEAWARWVRVRPHGWQTAPMFRQYRSKAWQWERPDPKPTTNTLEAVEMERAVSRLPEKHREAIRWAYVFAGSPIATARRLAVTKAGLLELIHAGRAMLGNRGA
jgi:DNA-directed RNA polymerase specialized sigma24 family protein